LYQRPTVPFEEMELAALRGATTPRSRSWLGRPDRPAPRAVSLTSNHPRHGNGMSAYMFDNKSAVEYERLDLMSKILDPWTRGYLTALGVSEGWRCLELGGGNGSITEWLSATIGPTGSVTALDVDPVLLGLIAAENVSVRQSDLRTDELPPGPNDLVTCRALLHQVAEDAPALLKKMGAAVKPGGWLLVQEPDFHLAPTTEPEAWARTWTGVIEWGRTVGVDWLIGRKLPGMVADLGLGNPQAKTDVQNIRGRDRGALYFQLFLAEVRDRVIESGHVDAETIDAASKLLDDPNYWTQCWMMTAVWMQKTTAEA
jgi:SAM-dependent methyltransferase